MDVKVLPKRYPWAHIIDKISSPKERYPNSAHPSNMNWTGFWILLKNWTRTMPRSSCKNGMEGSPESARTTQHKYVGYTHAHGHIIHTYGQL